MLGMLKRHEVEILLRAGHSKTEVARLAGVSLCSVKRIAEEVPVVHVDDAAERERSEEHTSELQSRVDLVCRLLLEKKKKSDEMVTRDDSETHVSTEMMDCVIPL